MSTPPRFIQTPMRRQPLSTTQVAQRVVLLLLGVYAIGVIATRFAV